MVDWHYIAPPEVVQKHLGPRLHPSGSPQSAHAGGKGKAKAVFTMAEAAKMKGRDLFEAAGGAQHELKKRYKFQVKRPDGKTDTWDIWQTYGKGRAKGSYVHASTGFGTKRYMHFRGTPDQTLDEFQNIA